MGEEKFANDITILLATDGKAWGDFITQKLNEFPQVSHTVLDVVKKNPAEVKSRCQQSAVVLHLTSHGMLTHMREKAGWFAPALRELSTPTTSVIALLLLDRKDLDDVTHKHGYVTREWRCRDAGTTCSEVQQRLAEVLDTVERNRQASRDRMSSSSSLGSSKPSVEFFPSTIHEVNTRVAMVFKEEIRGEVTLKLDKADTPLTTTQETGTVFTFTAPQKPAGRYRVMIFVDNKRRRGGRAELAFRGTEVASFLSLQYLAQALRLPSLGDLDLHLSHLFTQSVPADQGLEALFRHLPDVDPAERQKNADTQYPTMLHYAAAFGLSEFCTALLDCPLSSRAFCIRNCDGLDPAELASEHGFYELEDYILDVMEIQAEGDHSYMTMASLSSEEETSPDTMYANPLHFTLPTTTTTTTGESLESTTVQQQAPALPPRPDTLAPLSAPSSSPPLYWTMWSSDTGHIPVERSSPAVPADRPPMPLPAHSGGHRARSTRLSTPSPAHSARAEAYQNKACSLPRGAKLDASAFMGMDAAPQYTELPAGAMGSRSQSELIEVQEMVKRREISQPEALMLFRGWQNRYRNSAASFKDRQKALQEMKSEYKKQEPRQSQSATEPKNSLARFLFRRKVDSNNIKINISEPVLAPVNKKPTRVYSRVHSDSQLMTQSVDRDSAGSIAGLSDSSRDSGYSVHLRHSNALSTGEPEAGTEEEDDVFTSAEGIMYRRRDRQTSSSASKRLSLGGLYLQQSQGRTAKGRNTPPPLPPLPNLDILSKWSSDCGTDSEASEATHL